MAAVDAQDRLEQLKAQVAAEGGEILSKTTVVGQDNTRLQDLLEKEAAKKAKLAAKRAEKERKKKEAKGIFDDEDDEPVEEEKGKKGKKKNKKQDQ